MHPPIFPFIDRAGQGIDKPVGCMPCECLSDCRLSFLKVCMVSCSVQANITSVLLRWQRTCA